VAGWVRQRRLERCRRDLLDPASAARPVSAVAARWGLVNAAHFSRAFRAAYGLSPVEYRAMAGGRSGPP
jgi:AraC-like DNA-binding protein